MVIASLTPKLPPDYEDRGPTGGSDAAAPAPSYGDPEWFAVPIPYIPAEDEVPAMIRPGYTRIGYASFMMPPGGIVYSRQQPIDTKQILRATHSLIKGYGTSAREFQFRFDFKDVHEINRVLLPLIRQFQRTPFLPVVNHYLNDTLGVDALALQAVQISTVPGYPCLRRQVRYRESGLSVLESIIAEADEAAEMRGKKLATLRAQAEAIGDMKWVEWTPPGMVVENIEIGCENLLSAIAPQMQASPVHQFIGRTDTYVTVTAHIPNESSVNKLKRMLDKSEYLTRRYAGIPEPRVASG